MKVIKEGYVYGVQNLQDPSKEQVINFFDASNVEPIIESMEADIIIDGTTNEELLAVLIHRITYQNNLLRSKENSCCITKLEEGLMWLEKRTNGRRKRGVEGTKEA